MEWENHRPSAPSTPTSVSSQSTSGTNSSRERIPPYKQLTPSPAVTALAKLSDDELFRKGADELVRILRRVESDYKGLLSEHSSMVKDVNRRFQIFVLEARGLKEINQKLQDDNQELRDLCCFLDDDRQRSRKLAREWQRFGRYTASVMHSEVAAYQEKLRQLEERQAELLNDNMELKELCLFLDHERSQMSGDRDEGDGSSNGTMTGHEEMQQQSLADSDGQVTPTPTPTPSQQGESAAYIRQLEQKIQRLEEEKKQLAQRVERNGADGYHPADDGLSPHKMDTGLNQLGHASDKQHGSAGGLSARDGTAPSFSMNKPEAVVHAMKVLQVHEQLERPRDPVGSDKLGDTEKAIVREMCNVVWRKLGDSGDYPPTDSSFPPGAGPSNQPHRPQSAMASHISSGHPGPPRGAASNPASPTSPNSLPNSYQDGRPGQRPLPSSNAQPYQAGPSRLNQSMDGAMFPSGQGDRKGQSSQGARHSGGQSGPPYQSMQGTASGETNYSGQSSRNQPMQVPSFSQPVVPPAMHTAVRPSNASQPPPYSSSQPSSAPFGGPHSPGSHGPSQPLQYRQGPPQQLPQPHQQPPSRQQHQPPRYQQRIHPLHAQPSNPPPPPPLQAQPPQRPPTSRGMPPLTYYVGHPAPQSRHPSSSGLSSGQQSTAPSSSYLYSQRSGQGPPAQSSYRPYEQTAGPQRKNGTGQGEWRQTYLDD